MNPEHTEGPWEVYKLSTESHADELCIVVTEDLESEVTGVIYEESDASLIAAAPEMLEALENLENDNGAIPEHAWQMVQTSISKAKGGNDE